MLIRPFLSDYYVQNIIYTSSDTSTTTTTTGGINIQYGNSDPSFELDYDIGTLYLNVSTGELWACVAKDEYGTTWIGQISGRKIIPIKVGTIDILGDGSCVCLLTFDGIIDDASGNYTFRSINIDPYFYPSFIPDMQSIYFDTHYYLQSDDLTDDEFNSWTDVTFSFWMNPSVLAGKVLGFSGTGDMAIQFSGSSILVYIRSHVVLTTVPNYFIQNEWHHYAITLSSSQPAKYYRDGVLIGTVDSNTKTSVNGVFTVGNVIDYSGTSSMFNGYLSMLRIFKNKYLSDDEALILYNEFSEYLNNVTAE